MPQKAFGSGTMWGTPSGSNPTPVNFGYIQDGSINFNASTKNLFGKYQFPVGSARGTAKIEGKAKMGMIQGSLYAGLFFNASLTSGQRTTANAEAGVVPAPSGPYTITVANAANYLEDLGVISGTTGYPLTRVASGPTTGQYSVNTSTGVYTFAAADTGITMYISYRYSVSGSGQKFTISNQLLGIQPVFSLVLEMVDPSSSGSKSVIKLNKCIADKLDFATKLEDFVMPDFSFSAFADDTGTVGEFSQSSTD